MALEKETEWKGTTACYWMIVSRTWDKIAESTSCRLALYVNKAARNQSLHNFLEIRGFSFPGDLNVAELYAAIKEPQTDPEEKTTEVSWFSDAKDV